MTPVIKHVYSNEGYVIVESKLPKFYPSVQMNVPVVSSFHFRPFQLT